MRRSSSGRPGTNPSSSCSIAVSGERLERERRAVATARPSRPALGQLRPREREHEERVAARPLEQVLDEVEERGVGPLQVLEDEDDRACSASRSKKSRQAEKRSSRSGAVRSASPSRCASLGSSQPRSSASGTCSSIGARSLASARLGRLLLEDPGPHPHHLGERPVGDAVAVGEAAAPVPPEVVGEPVHVLLELPGEPRLADPGDPEDRDEVRLALLRAGVEELLDQPQLAVAADEGRLERRPILRPAARRPIPAARARAAPARLPFSSCSPASS